MKKIILLALLIITHHATADTIQWGAVTVGQYWDPFGKQQLWYLQVEYTDSAYNPPDYDASVFFVLGPYSKEAILTRASA